MELKLCRANRFGRHIPGVCLLFMVLIGSTNAFSRDEWFRGMDLEPALGGASLVLVGRVVDVEETRLVMGGKGERSLLQFKFEPVRVFKGVYSRESLSLTSDDLGLQRFAGGSSIKAGDLRLLMLGRSMQGYAIFHQSPNLEQAIPLLRSGNDELLESARVLLEVNESQDRFKKVALLLDGLHKQKGPAAVPLLAALARRPLLAAQASGVVEAIAPHLSDPSPAVREQAAKTFYSLLQSDYLNQRDVRVGAISALAASLDRSDLNFEARAAAYDALGAAGPGVLDNISAKSRLAEDRPNTFAEEAAQLRAVGQLKMPGLQGVVLALIKQVPLDAPPVIQYATEWALARLDPGKVAGEVMDRIKRRYDAGLRIGTDISVLGELPPDNGVPTLLEISKLSLDHAEEAAFATACTKVADPRLVAPLASMLAPSQPDLWWRASEALIKIDTDDAAKELQPHLREETNLMRKLEIAEFLGRHGIRDGYPYAIEHMSEPDLREQAVAALAAIRDPRAVGELRRILETSRDVAWNSAAIRALGRLGAVELSPQFLDLAKNAKNPLAPSALIALGDLHEMKSLEIARESFASRNPEMLAAGARAAGSLVALPGVKADDIRDQLASLLTDPSAPREARAAALDSLVALNDRRLDSALAQAVGDGGLEGSDLLDKIERLLRERKVKLNRP